MIDKVQAYSDNALVDLLKGQDAAAFEEIYRRYWRVLYSTCYKRIQSREISEEYVQDIFTSLWINRNLVVIHCLSAYLSAAIKYKVINHFARETSRYAYTHDQEHTSEQHHSNSTEESILLEDLNTALEREIEKLPAKRKQIFRLHKNENLSLKQVANQMGISEKTAENQYGKALKVLKVNLRHFTLSMGYALIFNELQEIIQF